MKKAKIVQAPSNGSSYIGTSIKNTGLTQRATLEEVIINLATLIGAKEIYKTENSRGAYFYEVQAPNFKGFQSASNTILELSRALMNKP